MLLASTAGPSAGRADARRPRVALSLFGGFALRKGRRLIAIKNRKAQALFAYLALTPSASEPRERLCGLLWSESSEEKARASLRQTLHGLRAALDQAAFRGLDVGRDDIGLGKSELDIDTLSVVEAGGRGEVHHLLLDRTGLVDTLLAGFDDIDPAFRVWLLVQRQSLQQQIERHLERALAEAGTRTEQLRASASALLNLDPTHEDACRRLMQDHAEQGDSAGALKIYKRLWDLLDEDYGSEPSEPTQALVVRIKNGELEARPTAAVAAKEPIPAEEHADRSLELGHAFLIVAPFDGGGVGPQWQHLVQGLRHELIAKLVRFRDWSVLDGQGLGQDLVRNATVGARRFSLDGTVHQAGKALSVSLTIKEQPSGRFVWSESFRLELNIWFDLQQFFVRRIAAALNIHLSTERLMAVARRPDISLSAYERWLRGEQDFMRFDPEAWTRAANIFELTINEAPEFSPAYSGLARLKTSESVVFPGVARLPETDRRALALGKMAVQTDPFDSFAHLALAWAFAMARQFDKAELSYRLALKLNDIDPWTSTSAALGFAFCGAHDEAVELATQALALNLQPSRTHWGFHATLRFLCADYAGCVEAAENAQEAPLNIPGWHAAALAHLGETRQAEAMARRFTELIGSHWHGKAPATEQNISTWFLHAFPIRMQADRERLRDGLLIAGIPVEKRETA